MSAPPLVNRRILEALLENRLPEAREHGRERRLVLVHGRYDPVAPPEFTTRIGADQLSVRVSDQTSVLGIVDAWQSHRASAGADDTAVLVVTTGVDDELLGVDLRGHALERRVLSVDRGEIVKQRFGAADLDPRIRRESWLIDALLDAEPAEGWRTAPAAGAWRRSGGAVLTRDAAVRSLIQARLFAADAAPERSLDADTLLAWSRTPAGASRFAELPPAEREGLTAWLRETVGEAVTVLLTLAAAGRGTDAMALGVVGAVLTDPHASADAALAVGGLFAGVSARPDELRAFTAAVHGTLARWITEAETGRSGHEAARARVMAVLDRADELASGAGLSAALADDPFLPSALEERLRSLAAALSVSPQAAEQALQRLTDHRLAGLYGDRCHVARMAVCLRRWLATPLEVPESVAAGVREHLGSLGWVDRAKAVLWSGDPGGDPVVGQAYHAIFEQVRARRAELDRVFADRLATWTPRASAQAPEGCLLIEEVLAQVAVPLAGVRAPLIVVLDGMSGAVATQLGEQLTRQGWIEATAAPGGRRAAVSMIPSVTTASRASLLSGKPVSGGQTLETEGFTTFWARHRHEALLVHKSDIPGAAGRRLAQPLLDALAGEQVVGVILNTIDDALDHGRQGPRIDWQVEDITHLVDLLAAARGAGRPVVLVSDHGHVLELGGSGSKPLDVPGAQSSRWRTGTPVEGEVELSGARVLENAGRITVPWREDIRYTPRKAGYHGGASLAEMTVPVLVMLPGIDLLPSGWTVLPPEKVTPAWWTGRDAVQSAPLPSPTPARGRQQKETLFAVATPAPSTLGMKVVGSPIYAEQKKYVRKAPDAAQVAAVIDALAAADARLSPAAVNSAAAEAGGRAPRDPDLFVTMLQRLLNVEGYLVLGLIDSGRTVELDVALLREQFGVNS
ncbi:BREX-2 system phosphatase PglZ [Actinoallomurus sp. CA-142502]|uniref:BREX-2 system phosphatase PglZ n=1 Tax=Actinoallomurus sp. CA-142502 TaxID=3239885 RepID=UPI003D8F1665